MSDVSCICDANIWIDACHCDAERDYLTKYAIVGFIEQVHNEIIKFKNNDGKFKYIYTKYQDNNSYYKVLKTSDLGVMEFQFISQLRSKGFTEIDNTSETIKDLGEYASLYYAYHMGIPYIHTTDTQFLHEEKDKLPGIQMITWNEINAAISRDDNERIAKNKIIDIKKRELRKSKSNYEEEKESKDLMKRLEMLANLTNKNRNI